MFICILAFRFHRHELFALCDELMHDLEGGGGAALQPMLQIC